MREEYLRSKHEFREVRSFLLATREKLEASEKQVAAWKDECRLVILKGHDKEDRFEATLERAQAEMSTMASEIAELRASVSTPQGPSPAVMMRFAAIEKERDELRVALKKSEEQLDLFRRDIFTLKYEILCHGSRQVHVEVRTLRALEEA